MLELGGGCAGRRSSTTHYYFFFFFLRTPTIFFHRNGGDASFILIDIQNNFYVNFNLRQLEIEFNDL
jgi:hypothetical protein